MAHRISLLAAADSIFLKSNFLLMWLFKSLQVWHLLNDRKVQSVGDQPIFIEEFIINV